MVAEAGGRTKHEMARFSIVDYHTGEVIDMIVRPRLPVVDFLTSVSGITQADIDATEFTPDSVTKWIKDHIGPLTILIAHHAKMDFTSIGFQPHDRVIDTAKLFPHPQLMSGQPSLEVLAKRYLHRDLAKERADAASHSSVADSIVCCDLVRLLQQQGMCTFSP